MKRSSDGARSAEVESDEAAPVEREVVEAARDCSAAQPQVSQRAAGAGERLQSAVHLYKQKSSKGARASAVVFVKYFCSFVLFVLCVVYRIV